MNLGVMLTMQVLLVADVSDPASSVGVPSVRPGAVPFVSCRAGAYGRLLIP